MQTRFLSLSVAATLFLNAMPAIAGCIPFAESVTVPQYYHGYSHVLADGPGPGTSSARVEEQAALCDDGFKIQRRTNYLSGPGNSDYNKHETPYCDVLDPDCP